MKVKFTEGPEALNVPAAGVVAERDQAVEVPDEIGKNLIKQGWVEAGSTAKKESK